MFLDNSVCMYFVGNYHIFFCIAISTCFCHSRRLLHMLLFNSLMFVIAKVVCDAWWLALVSVGPLPVYEKVCVGDSSPA